MSIDLECPACGSVNSDRYGGPITRRGRVYRRHRCRNCRRLFVTEQHVVSQGEARDVVAELEEMAE